MQDQLSQSTVQSLVVLMPGQQPFHLFVYIEDTYFRAATTAAQESGLTTEAFVQQQLSSWFRRVGINPMRQQVRLQAVQPNSRRSQDVQQPPARKQTGHRVNESPEQPSPQSENFVNEYVNVGRTNSNQNRHGSQAHQDGSPIIQPFNDDGLDSQRQQNSSILLRPNSRAITFEENSMDDQCCSFNLSKMSSVRDNQKPVVSSCQSPEKTSLKQHSRRVQADIKANNAANRANVPSPAQQFERVQVLPQPGNGSSFPGHSPYEMALEPARERGNQMNSANRQNLSVSSDTLLMSPNAQELHAENPQRSVNSFNSHAQVVSSQVVRVVARSTQPQNRAPPQTFQLYQSP